MAFLKTRAVNHRAAERMSFFVLVATLKAGQAK
jgi:hypothetical protein